MLFFSLYFNNCLRHEFVVYKNGIPAFEIFNVYICLDLCLRGGIFFKRVIWIHFLRIFNHSLIDWTNLKPLFKGLASHIYESDKLRWIPNATFRRDKNQLLYKDLYYFWNQSLYRLHYLYNSFQREKMKINLFIFSLYV